MYGCCPRWAGNCGCSRRLRGGREEDLRAAGKGAVSVSGLLCLSEGSALCLEAQDFGWGHNLAWGLGVSVRLSPAL